MIEQLKYFTFDPFPTLSKHESVTILLFLLFEWFNQEFIRSIFHQSTLGHTIATQKIHFRVTAPYLRVLLHEMKNRSFMNSCSRRMK